MTVSERQCGPQASVILMRELVMQLCAAGIKTGRLSMFSDYAIDEATRARFVALDEKIGALIDEAGVLEDENRDKVFKLPAVPNDGSC